MDANTIIALRGKHNSGKSATIRILHDLMPMKGYQLIRSTFKTKGGDFIAVFSKNGKLIGLTSSGDMYDLVHDRLMDLVNADCSICICACRTYDRVLPGTNAAVVEFTTYRNKFIEKAIDENQATQLMTNTKDANEILSTIEELIS